MISVASVLALALLPSAMGLKFNKINNVATDGQLFASWTDVAKTDPTFAILLKGPISIDVQTGVNPAAGNITVTLGAIPEGMYTLEAATGDDIEKTVATSNAFQVTAAGTGANNNQAATNNNNAATTTGGTNNNNAGKTSTSKGKANSKGKGKKGGKGKGKKGKGGKGKKGKGGKKGKKGKGGKGKKGNAKGAKKAGQQKQGAAKANNAKVQAPQQTGKMTHDGAKKAAQQPKANTAKAQATQPQKSGKMQDGKRRMSFDDLE